MNGGFRFFKCLLQLPNCIPLALDFLCAAPSSAISVGPSHPLGGKRPCISQRAIRDHAFYHIAKRSVRGHVGLSSCLCTSHVFCDCFSAYINQLTALGCHTDKVSSRRINLHTPPGISITYVSYAFAHARRGNPRLCTGLHCTPGRMQRWHVHESNVDLVWVLTYL